MIYMKEQCNFCITIMDVFYGNNINPVSFIVSVLCSIHTLKGSCVCHVACVLETSKPSLSACSQRTCPISAQRQSVKVSREPQLKQRIPLCPRAGGRIDEDKSMFRWPQWHGLAEKQQGCVTSHKLVSLVTSNFLARMNLRRSESGSFWIFLAQLWPDRLLRLPFLSSWPSIPL